VQRGAYLSLVVVMVGVSPVVAQRVPSRQFGTDAVNRARGSSPTYSEPSSGYDPYRGRGVPEPGSLNPGQANSLDQYDPTIPPRTPSRRNEPPVRWVTVCPRCDNEVSEFRDEICPHCGFVLVSAPAANPSGPSAPTSTFSEEGARFVHSPGGHKLIALVLGGIIAGFFGIVAWVMRKRYAKTLDQEYKAAVQSGPHSITQVLQMKGKRSPGDPAATASPSSTSAPVDPGATPGFAASTARATPTRPPSKGQWLLDRGLKKLEQELDRGGKSQPSCGSCRYAGVGGPSACPYAFSCGVLQHPRADIGYAVRKGFLWFGFCLLIAVVVIFALSVFPVKNPQRPMSEAIPFAAPGLLGIAALAGGISFVWHFSSVAKIRHQVREARKAAQSLGLEYCNFQELSPETGSLALPLLVPGEPTLVQAIMRGTFRGHDVLVAYYEYEFAERYGPGSDAERKMAVVRGAIGKEFYMKWGQMVLMFPEPLDGWPTFLISPRKDLDYLLEREVGGSSLDGPQAAQVRQLYCVASPMKLAGMMFDDEFQRFLLEHPGWNVQNVAGRLMLWRGKLDELSAEILPGDAAQVVADLEQAVAWRGLLERKGMDS